MELSEAIVALSALAQQTRLETFRLLVRREPEGLRAGEVARLMAVPQNTMSAHLAVLARCGLVRGERRSRSIVYRADLIRFRAVVTFLVRDCCDGRPEHCAPLLDDLVSLLFVKGVPPVAERAFNVLFLCTGNTARSILAEEILRKDGAARFKAFSAGSHPKGAINPFALKVLGAYGYPTDGFRSKGWDEFAVSGAPEMDFVFTVCDSAAGEACPVWPGQPMTAHWGIEDPAAVEGSDVEKERAFNTAFRYLKNRISVFTSLPIRSLDKLTVNQKLREIGRLEGATTKTSGVTMMSIFERYLTIWVFLCIVAGVALGHALPGLFHAIGSVRSRQGQSAGRGPDLADDRADAAQDRLLRARPGWRALAGHRRHPAHQLGASSPSPWLRSAGFSSGTSFGPGCRLTRSTPTSPGLILLAAAPCTAMVFVWSNLMKGEPHFTLSQVALNDTIMVFAFAPIVGLLLGLSAITVPWDTLVLSVVLYIVIPVIVAQGVQTLRPGPWGRGGAGPVAGKAWPGFARIVAGDARSAVRIPG